MRGSITAADLDDAVASLQALGPDLANRALADALNHTANQTKPPLRAAMESVFDNPSPWVLNSIRIINARPDNLEAVVTVKDDLGGKGRGFDEWFSPQVYGGNRLIKGSEKMLRERGILPAGSFIVPTRWTPLDSRGGIRRSWMTQVLSGLSTFSLAGSDHNATDSRRSAAKGHAKAFFVIKRGKRPIGIAERRGKEMQVVLQFTRSAPTYRERFDFHGVVRRVAENDALLETNIDLAITKALQGRAPSNFRRRPRDATGRIVR
ncbi:hypothetical protein EQ832_11980 [Pseudomonas sp. ALS1131]|nr:hypothetical protein EQ832_11980 [Pseudomonas sp. ALS1131]